MDKETGFSEMEEMEITSSVDRQSSVKGSHFHNGTPRRLSFRQKLKAHLKKWWWLQLIVFIAITLLITLILVYVAFPKIAQSGVDNSTLSISSLVISNPTESSFHLHQVSTITSSSAYHPQLDAFNASLSLVGGAPYAYITIPALVAAATATATVDQDVQIIDLDAFTAYNVALLNNTQVQMAVQGNTGLHEMAFPETNVNYDKVVTMNGLNKLAGFAVTSFSIKLLPDPDGTNMVGTVSIPNPSPITVAMGNVTMNIYNQGVFLGTSTLPNLTLMPGNNSVPMTSITNQTQVLTLITEQYKDGLLPIDIIGNSSVFNGVHLTYFEKALASVTQHVTLDVGSALKAVGVNLTSSL